MSTRAEVIVHRDAEELASATGARLAAKLLEVQAAGRTARIVLTGGGSGIGLLAALNSLPARDEIDWQRVELFWGDERFVSVADPERNEKQARDALLDHVALDASLVHAMAASDGRFGTDVDAAAADYAEILGTDVRFDVVMLGMGPEGHVASIFPDSPAVHEHSLSVVPVRDCPKPPPTRISLTLPTIRTADEVWIVTGGEGKAEAVELLLGGAAEVDLPAAGAIGTARTLFLLDKGSASRLPPGTVAETAS
ncbi:6-phosphogluconolactonase [Nakamurella sp. UYEF19]|uniref:6-phosphogluconolactonase n=1 Tax=Nakamurella sp. UYEF19 TaxID=1756392 RepID=UPI00339B7073